MACCCRLVLGHVDRYGPRAASLVDTAGNHLAAYLDEPVAGAVAGEHAAYLVTGHPLGDGTEVEHHARVALDEGVAAQLYLVHPDELQDAVQLSASGHRAALVAETPRVDQRHHCRVKGAAALTVDDARGLDEGLDIGIDTGGGILVEGGDERGAVIGRDAHVHVAQDELDAVAQVMARLVGDVVLCRPHHALKRIEPLAVTGAEHQHDAEHQCR